jgi:hypothetical protein
VVCPKRWRKGAYVSVPLWGRKPWVDVETV